MICGPGGVRTPCVRTAAASRSSSATFFWTTSVLNRKTSAVSFSSELHNGMNKIPLATLRYVTVVVNDAKAMARHYADFYGIERWNVTNATPERLQAMTIRGRVPTTPPPFDLNG